LFPISPYFLGLSRDEIENNGVEINYRSVQAFFKRWVRRKTLPLGWETEPRQGTNRPSLKQAPAELPQIREKEKGHEWPTREEANQIIQ
jgi:hypothetical protein